MGRCYLKPNRDSTHYVEWSSVVDSVVGYGTRAEFLADEREEHGRHGEGQAVEALNRADEHGTSDRVFRFGGWDDAELHVMEGGGPGFLARRDLEQYALLLCEKTPEATAKAAALLRPDPQFGT